jgi:hypothetical protein
VARPRPVVDLSAVVADGALRNVDEAEVLDLHVLDQLELGALEEGAELALHVGAILLALRDQRLLAVLELLVARVGVGDLGESVAHPVGDVADLLGDVDRLVRAGRDLGVACLREEAVLDEVVVRRRVEPERLLHAVMVGDDQTVGGDERGRAEEPAGRA